MTVYRGCFVLLVALTFSACGADEQTGVEIPCTDDELYDQVADVCVPRARTGNNSDNNRPDMGEQDAGIDLKDDNNSTTNNATNNTNNIDPACDRDRDGALAMSCGGNDCDDLSIYRSPNNFELCDEYDNDCSGVVNDGIDCTFYAHSGRELYRIDPFQFQISTVGTELPNLQDIDTHPDGTLYGVSFDGLYRFDAQGNQWMKVGDFGINIADPNGMAIDLEGTAFVTSQTEVYSVDVTTGAATLLGDMQQDFYSSGDIVVNKYDTIFMTSKHDPAEDNLVVINRADGKGEQVGPIGFKNVFAMTSAWGFLYGLTGQGEVITIDINTGAGELVYQFEDYRFFGAASTPQR